MQMATTLRRSTYTFLTHLFGPGLDDDRYVIERFQSKSDGEIRPRRRNGSSKKGRGKASREIVSLSTVQRMRPERDEIIICTGVNRTTLGVSILGGSRDGLVRERQVSLTRGRRGRAAGLRRPDVLRQDYNRGRRGHAIQKIPRKNVHAGGGGMNALPPTGSPAACVRGAGRRGPRPIGPCVGTAAKSVARPSAQDARRPRRLAYHTGGRDAERCRAFVRDRGRRRDRARQDARTCNALRHTSTRRRRHGVRTVPRGKA